MTTATLKVYDGADYVTALTYPASSDDPMRDAMTLAGHGYSCRVSDRNGTCTVSDRTERDARPWDTHGWRALGYQ